jgi:hypothetical protein
MLGPLILRAEKDGVIQELYDRPGAPEIYVDGFHGIFAAGATIKFNLFTRPFQVEAPEEGQMVKLKVDRREVAARIVMGVDAFFATVDALNEVAAELKKAFDIGLSAPPKGAANDKQ